MMSILNLLPNIRQHLEEGLELTTQKRFEEAKKHFEAIMYIYGVFDDDFEQELGFENEARSAMFEARRLLESMALEEGTIQEFRDGCALLDPEGF